MDSRSITRKISYFLLISAVVGAIFYFIHMYTVANTYYFEKFRSDCYRWLLLITAFTASYYGAILTAKIRKIGVIEELIAIPVKKKQIILGIFISRVLIVWIPVFIAFTIIGIWSNLIESRILTIVTIGFCLLVFITFFTSVGYFLSFVFSTAFYPIIFSFLIILLFWYMASAFPYWGNLNLTLQQQIYKLNAGFNPFTFMYALGLSNFLYAPFLFILLMVPLLLFVTCSIFSNSGWFPGDTQAKFRIRKLIALRNFVVLAIFFFIFAGLLATYVGFYSLDTSSDKSTTPSDALLETAPEISTEFSPDNVDLLRYSIFFDKLARKANNRIAWAPTSSSNWSGAILFNDSSDELCIEMGFIGSTEQDRDLLALKLGNLGVSRNVQKIDCRPNLNQLAILENIALSFSARGESRSRIFAVGMGFTTGIELPSIVEQEAFEIVIPPSIDYIERNLVHSRDILLIAPLQENEFSERVTEKLLSMINGGVAAFILLPELFPIENPSGLYERKLTDSLGKVLEKMSLEVSIGKFKYKELDNYISDNTSVCCYADYVIYAPYNAPNSTNMRIKTPIEFYSLRAKNKKWNSLLTCCEDVQFENAKNHRVSVMMYNPDKNVIVAGIQNVQNRRVGTQYEISRNLIANGLNICARKKFKNSKPYNIIRRKKIASDILFNNKKHSNIDMMLIITYIIWLAAIILTILRVMKNWRYLGAKI